MFLFCNHNIYRDMKIPLIKIGNSQGIRLPKIIIKKYDIKNSLEVILEKDRIILKPVTEPRQGWAEKFKEMAKNEDDQLLIDDVFEDEFFE